MSAFLITGTDTGVGKTFITYNIACGLISKGIRTGCLKPIETGVLSEPEDGNLLAGATGQKVQEVVPITYRKPLSPYAAILEGEKEFSLEKLYVKFMKACDRYDVVLVEGAGGLAVPLTRDVTFADLAAMWSIPIIIVARAGLGTINHTYLTWYYAKSKGLHISGIVMNGFTGLEPSEHKNPQIIYEMTGIKPVCIEKHNGKRVSSSEREELLKLIRF